MKSMAMVRFISWYVVFEPRLRQPCLAFIEISTGSTALQEFRFMNLPGVGK